jgi:hypothetical protein
MSQLLKETLVYKRDANGHLLCERCGFKPKSTPRHPNGNPSTMHYHMKKHTNDFPYECSICKSGFPQKQNLLNHMKARHPNDSKEKDNMFKCPIDGCNFQSVTKGNCLIHCARRHFANVVDDHIQTITENNERLSHCSCCNKNFKSGTAFYYHILKCLSTFDRIDTNEIETLL